MFDLLGDFILQTFLVEDSLLHLRALLKVGGAHVVDFLQKIYLLGRCLLESQSDSPLCLLLEVAIIAKGGVVGAGVNLQFFLVLTKLDSLVLEAKILDKK